METIHIKDFLAWKPPKVEEIIEGGILIPESRLIIHGKFKSWKSMIAMHTGFCISNGLDWLGLKTISKPVLIVQIEVAKIPFHTRVVKYTTHNISDPDNMWIVNQYNLKLDSAYGLSDLDKAIGNTKAEVVIIDPLYKIVSGDLNDTRDVTKLLDNLDFMREKHHCSFIIIHHERKSQGVGDELVERGAEEMTGSQSVANWCDAAVSVHVKSDTYELTRLRMEFTALRNSPDFMPPMDIEVRRSDLKFIKKSDVIVPEDIKHLLNMKETDKPDDTTK